jgi:hypothetical protein
MKEKLKKMLKRCWEGYKATPGVKAYEKGSCMKKDELEKGSKNVREQKKALFGTSGNPGKKSPKTQNQMTALNNLAQRRYGVDVKPSGGKIDEKTGGRRSANPEIGVDKPDWRSGSIEAQQNPNAVTHELGHLEIMPEGVDAPSGQRLMDKQYGDVQKLYGYLQQKKSQGEIQPMSMENPIRRRAGLPATTEGMDVKPGTPERTAVDTGGPAAIRVPKGEKERDLIRQSRLMNPENKARLEDVDQGIVKYNPKRGWQPSHSGDALINLRAQGRHEEANKRSKAKFAMMMRRKKKAAPQKLAASELNKSKNDMPAIARRSGYQLGSKGIHQPTATPGVSAVGINVRKIKQPGEQKAIHQNKLAELKAMPKPKLPKAELEKAKIDTGTPDQKAAQRHQRTRSQELHLRPSCS